MATRKTSPWVRGFSLIVLTPVLAVGAFSAYLYSTQEAMIFPGTKLPRDHAFVFDVPYEEIMLPVDGAEINALHFRQPNPRGLIFFLHGNGGNLQSWTSNAEYYQRVNYDMFMLDYRGYGKSTGRIESEEQLHDDVRAAWNSVASLYDGKPIVIYGRSLGTALATRLAVEVDPALLILVSPFTSVVAMAREQYPFLPEWLLRFPLRTDELIGQVDSPIVLVHGSVDRLIAPDHSYELAKLSNAPTKVLVIDGAGHNDIHVFEQYLKGLTAELPD